MEITALPKRTFHLKALLFFVALTLGAGFFGALLGGFSGFGELVKPPLTLHIITSPSFWSVLFIASGIAAYLVWNINDIDGPRVLRLYLLQLLLGALWPLIFFRLKMRLVAFFLLLSIIAIASLVLTGFRYIRKSAYRLMLPYFISLVYTAYLNIGFFLLNN